eukprot:9467582-Pyramimonas_sp.AAC.1
MPGRSVPAHIPPAPHRPEQPRPAVSEQSGGQGRQGKRFVARGPSPFPQPPTPQTTAPGYFGAVGRAGQAGPAASAGTSKDF